MRRKRSGKRCVEDVGIGWGKWKRGGIGGKDWRIMRKTTQHSNEITWIKKLSESDDKLWELVITFLIYCIAHTQRLSAEVSVLSRVEHSTPTKQINLIILLIERKYNFAESTRPRRQHWTVLRLGCDPANVQWTSWINLIWIFWYTLIRMIFSL